MKSSLNVFWIGALALLGAQAHAANGHEHMHGHSAPAPKPSAPASSSVFNLEDSWTTQEGKSFRLSDFSGHPALLAMIYTSCKGACPLIIEDMKKIEAQLSPEVRKKVKFAAFSFDPKRDTVEKLAAYRQARNIPAEWTLARGDAKAVRKLAAVLGMKYKKIGSGDFEHSNLITVLDKNGVVKGQQTGLGKSGKELAELLERLAGE